MWHGQIAALSKDCKLIIWDMRGHGRSDYPDDPEAYSEPHTVADMLAILDEVVGPSGKAIVGGLSLGGYMSMAFYRKHAERVQALLIIDTGPGFKKDSAREAWNKTAYETADRFKRDGLKSLQHMSAERATVNHRNAKGLELAARGMLSQRDSSVMDTLPNIKVPSMVVVGGNDTPFLAASEYMAKKIPNCKRAIIPNAGHAVNIDQPQAFVEAVLPFLQYCARLKANL